MRRKTLLLLARHLWRDTFHSTAIYGILILMFCMIAYASYTGATTYFLQNDIREHYQKVARESWENNPDKHPHRMAHYGSFAFRIKHPLSIFDFGIESFTGNAVYLEAHKQNTVNFSEASYSTGLLRFGEISMAMILHMILPLVIVFLGFKSIAADRENGTLKMMLAQGAAWREIIVGKALGLFILALLIAVPSFLVMAVLLFFTDGFFNSDLLIRYAGVVFTYLIFLAVMSIITVVVSATSSSAKSSLLKLLGLWLLLAVLVPRTTQALGSYIFPSPSKVVFETAIEEDVLQEGDSHDPDDPHYKHLRDSVLRVHSVDSIEQLPFNYSGFVMREGERISSAIYSEHLVELMQTYDRQNSLSKFAALVNPFTAIRNLSMALSGTDFESYKLFQAEAESYRYQLTQKMNELQMEYISNRKPGPDDKPHAISREHWKELPDFKPRFLSVRASLKREVWSVMALCLWGIASLWLINKTSKNVKIA